MELTGLGLSDLTPLVAVCVIFAILLSTLMAAFLKHLNAKDERTEKLFVSTQEVLSGIQAELNRLSENDRQQNEILRKLLLLAYKRRAGCDEPSNDADDDIPF